MNKLELLETRKSLLLQASNIVNRCKLAEGGVKIGESCKIGTSSRGYQPCPSCDNALLPLRKAPNDTGREKCRTSSSSHTARCGIFPASVRRREYFHRSPSTPSEYSPSPAFRESPVRRRISHQSGRNDCCEGCYMVRTPHQ